MYENSIGWITCADIDLSSYVLSVPERLNKFGYAVVLEQLGSGLLEIAELGIIHTLIHSTNPTPKILIVCPKHSLQSWYASLLWDIGIEFKEFTPRPNRPAIFSENLTEFLIISNEHLKEVLKNDEGKKMLDINMVWDLMIIDADFDINGIDVSFYLDHMSSKAKKLIISVPVASKYNETAERIKGLLEHLLYHKEEAEEAKKHSFDYGIVGLNLDSPYLKNNKLFEDYKVKMLNYTIDKNYSDDVKRIDYLGSGLRAYTLGGNVFEEYSLDLRHIYLKSEYTKENLYQLMAVDNKLQLFLNELGWALNKQSATAVVYCVYEPTLKYLYKAIVAMFPEYRKLIKIIKDNHVGSENVLDLYGTEDLPCCRILLAMDEIGSRFFHVKSITDIFNYEYPENPLVLQQRYARRGTNMSVTPTFYLFSDTDYRFDGRVLRNVILLNMHHCFREDIPTHSVLFSIPNLTSHLMALILNLKFISSYTAEIGSAFDVVAHFKRDYNIDDKINLSTSARTCEYTGSLLKRLVNLFDVGDIVAEKNVDEVTLLRLLTEKVDEFKNNSVHYEKDELKLVSIDSSLVKNISEIGRDGEKIADVIKNAVLLANTLVENNSEYGYIHDVINNLPDVMQFAFLQSHWKYYKYEKGIKHSFSSFTRLFNKGVI